MIGIYNTATIYHNVTHFLFIVDNLKSRTWSFECLSCICPGFDVLQKSLVNHIHLPQVYGAIAALLIGKSDFQVPAGQVDVTALLSDNSKCIVSACIFHGCDELWESFYYALSFGWQVDVDMMLQSLIDSCSDGSESVQLCADAACVLLELVKVIITKVSVSKLLNLFGITWYIFIRMASYVLIFKSKLKTF